MSKRITGTDINPTGKLTDLGPVPEVSAPARAPEREKSTQEKWDDGKMRDQIGIFVDVDRSKQSDDSAKRANAALNEIGSFIHQNTPGIKDLKYCGSAAVHIYLAEALNQVVYVSQVEPLGDTAERLAGPGFTDLQKQMMLRYGRAQTKIRSGF